MARPAVLALLLVGLFCSLAPAQDFDLSDAVPEPTRAPPKKPPSADGGFNLEDALNDGGKNEPAKPMPKPKPREPGSSGGFSDSDLSDGTSGGGTADGGSRGHDGKQQDDSPGMISGIALSVVAAVVGAISSFIAYQKKKLCFKESTDQNDMNMENQPSTKAEPLLQ